MGKKSKSAKNGRSEKSQKSFKNGGVNQKESVSCISKELYDKKPQSDFILVQIFFNILHASLINMSKLRVGQAMISILDYYMIKIENTLDFCVPDSHEFAAQRVIEKHKRTLPIKDRPMSWLLFIPALIFLRMIRFIFSVWSIILGKGEVTAQHMQSKVIQFRRYYRSIRHFSVTLRWTEEDLKNIERRKEWMMWRVYYYIYEMVFMIKPLVESHQHAHKNGKAAKAASNGNGCQKQSLNVNASDSDEDLNANQLLDKYADMNDSLTADPDYIPQDIDGNSTGTDVTSDSDIERTESQRKLNDDFVPDSCEITSGNAYSSDIDKSNDPISLWLNDEKIFQILKEVQTASLRSFPDEIFYSPIDSPPETASRGYNSDSELHNNHENIGNQHN